MSTGSRYWLFQGLGWGLYACLGLGFTAYQIGWSLALGGGYVLFALYSIVLTEIFRQVMKRGKWLEPPGRWLWLRLPAGVLSIAAIQFALVISINMLLQPGSGMWGIQAALGLAWGLITVTGGWTFLYVKLTERRRFEEREVQIQLALREAELRALQNQVNPHFLFNSLNSIRGLVIENPPKAQEMVTRLANMLRYNLQRDTRDTAPVDAEVRVAADYLALEAVRFEERLRSRFEVDPALNDMEIPVMLLQTLVENAVKHGIAPSAAGGDVIVRVDRRAANVRVEVVNSGQLRATGPGAVGLANARERLRLLYGDRASLALSNGDGRVTATVLIPVAR